MIRRLRRRFIRIAMLSVAVVMLLLTLIVNGANFASANSDLRRTLDMICENQGTIPVPDHFTVPDGDTLDPPEPPAGRVLWEVTLCPLTETFFSPSAGRTWPAGAGTAMTFC